MCSAVVAEADGGVIHQPGAKDSRGELTQWGGHGRRKSRRVGFQVSRETLNRARRLAHVTVSPGSRGLSGQCWMWAKSQANGKELITPGRLLSGGKTMIQKRGPWPWSQLTGDVHPSTGGTIVG